MGAWPGGRPEGAASARVLMPAADGRASAGVVLAGLAALLAGGALGAAIGAGAGTTMIALGLIAPFALLLLLARPHWAAVAYLVLVYSDLLSILVRYHDFPALARFAGLALVSAVLGYRLFVQKQAPASDRVTLWLLAYGAMVALGLLYARSPELVAGNLVEFARAFFTYIVVINVITDARRLHAALYALMGAGTLLATLTVYQSLTGRFDETFGGLAQYRVSDIAGSTEAARPGGTVGDANYYGQMLLVVLPVALYLLFDGRTRWGRIAGFVCAGLLAAGVVFTYSRGDALALGAVGLAALIYKRPRLPVIVGCVLVLLLALPILPPNYLARLTTVVEAAQGNRLTIYGEDSIRGRAGATQAAIEMFADHPLLGVGRENYPLHQLEYTSGTGYARVAKGIPPHNLYLEVAAEHGLLGTVIFGALLLAAWGALMEARKRFKAANAWQEHRLTGWLAIIFIGYLVSALSLHGAFLYVLWLIISLMVAARVIARRYTPAWAVANVEDWARSGLGAPLGAEPAAGAALARPVSRWWQRRARKRAVETPTGQVAGAAFQVAQQPERTQPGRAAERDRVFIPWHSLGSVETWLAAAEAAIAEGNVAVARAMVELALERDPYSQAAWNMHLRMRLGEVGEQEHGSWQQVGQRPVHSVDDRVYNYWHAHGGLAVFGYPISARFYEVDRQGELVEVQYFERARLEYRRPASRAEGEVRTGLLGHEAEVRGAEAGGELPAGLDGEMVIFSVGDGQIEVPRRFFDFWEANGGSEVLGMPLTPVLTSSDGQGHPVWLQYFDRACLEFHPQLARTVYGVQVARLGSEIFRRRYGQQHS